MKRRTLTTLTALFALGTGALTAAWAGDRVAPTVSSSSAPAAAPTVGSIIAADPLHGLMNAVVQGIHTLYQQPNEVDGSDVG